MKNSYNLVRIKTITSFKKPKATTETRNAIVTATMPGEAILLKLSVIINISFTGEKFNDYAL